MRARGRDPLRAGRPAWCAVALLALPLVSAACTSEHPLPPAPEVDPRASVSAEPPAAPSTPSPFPTEWLEPPTWARLSAIESRERAATSSCVRAEPEIVGSAECEALTRGHGFLAIAMVESAPGRTAPRPLDVPVDVLVEARIAETRERCAPVIAAWLDAPDPEPCAPGGRPFGGVALVVAWDEARAGRRDAAARLLARTIGALTRWSRAGLTEHLAAAAAIDDAVATLGTWRDEVDPATRDATRAELERAASRIDPDRSLTVELLTRAEDARGRADEPHWAAIEWDICLTLLEELRTDPAALARARARARERLAGLRRPAGRFTPDDREWMIASRTGALVEELERQRAGAYQTRDRLRALAASW